MSRSNKYEGECGSCEDFYQCRGSWDTPYDVNDTEKGYCSYYKTTYWPDDSCGHYSKRGSYHGGPCYITTIVCNILGFDDNCEVLNNLRNLRDNFMQKREEYKKDLYDYDTIGPIIAKILADDFNETKDNTVANTIYKNYLVPTSEQVKDNNYLGAIYTYKNMTNILKETYNIKTNDEISKDYDQSIGGHGYIKTREA